MKIMVVMLAGLILLFPSATRVRAQSAVPPPGPGGPALAPAQVDQLVGPIALYPDPLIAEILPAATFPSEIVMANRYLSQNGDPNQIAAQGWDPSVQALSHYANILKWMDDNLAWTTQLGQVFQNQQADVMDSIQRLRAQAQGLGNLPSTPQESVSTDDGNIEIEPTDPDEMYVPSYPADTIYDQSGVYCTFPYELPLGIWLGYDWNWHNHGLIFWGPGHPRPGNWWNQTAVQRQSYFVGHPAPAWHAGRGLAVGARGGWERGFATPQERAPIIVNVRPAPIYRQSAALPEESHQEFRSEPSGGFFVGGQSGHEAVESISRGQASRASMGGGGGGGGHGGGGGGGGGGGHGGGGGRR
jgi:uncharacterized membrane protein YgcG